MKNLKSAIKIRTTTRLSVSFNGDTDGLNGGRQVAVRYYIEKRSHCLPFVFNKLRDKTHFRFSFDSPSEVQVGHFCPVLLSCSQCALLSQCWPEC